MGVIPVRAENAGSAETVMNAKNGRAADVRERSSARNGRVADVSDRRHARNGRAVDVSDRRNARNGQAVDASDRRHARNDPDAILRDRSPDSRLGMHVCVNNRKLRISARQAASILPIDFPLWGENTEKTLPVGEADDIMSAKVRIREQIYMHTNI